MRTTSLVTISLPPAMAAESKRVARQRNMTRSELLRAALRRYLEEISVKETKKADFRKLQRQDTQLWRKIEKSFRRIRSELTRERYPYLYE